MCDSFSIFSVCCNTNFSYLVHIQEIHMQNNLIPKVGILFHLLIIAFCFYVNGVLILNIGLLATTTLGILFIAAPINILFDWYCKPWQQTYFWFMWLTILICSVLLSCCFLLLFIYGMGFTHLLTEEISLQWLASIYSISLLYCYTQVLFFAENHPAIIVKLRDISISLITTRG